MFMIKKILCGIVLFSVFILCGCGKKEELPDKLTVIKERGHLIVGVKYDTKPFGFVDRDNVLKGYDIDLARIIAKKILGNEKQVVFKQVYPHNRIAKLNSGEVDLLIATMTITPQREEVVRFSKPYYTVGQAIMVPQGSSVETIANLNGKRTIVVLGTTGEKNLRRFAPEARVLGYKTYEEGFRALREKRAMAFTTDDTILSGFAQDYPEFVILPQRYTKEGYAIAMKKSPSTDSLAIDIDNILEELTRDGTLVALKHKWVPSESDKFILSKRMKRQIK